MSPHYANQTSSRTGRRHTYNGIGERTTTAIGVNQDGQINFSGTERITVSTTEPGTYDTTSVLTTATVVYATDGTDAVTPVSTSHRTPDGLRSWTVIPGVANPSHSRTVLSATAGSWTETTTNPDGTFVKNTYSTGQLQKTESFDAGATPALIAATSVLYDGLKRPWKQTDSRTGPTETTYLSATCDAVKSVTAPGTLTTSFKYDFRGNRTATKHPDASFTYTTYLPDGHMEATWGSQTYSVIYSYDYAGRMLTLRTCPEFDEGVPTQNGGAVTFWRYSPDNGHLTGKFHNYSTSNLTDGPTYDYTPGGRLLTRLWKRSLSTTYYHNSAGDLRAVNYSDSTPDVLYDRDRLGRITTASQGTLAVSGGTPSMANPLRGNGYVYDQTSLALNSETQPLGGGSRTLDRYHDNLGRPLSLQLGTDYTTAYDFDNAGRPNRVWDHPALVDSTKVPVGNPSFTYGYKDGSLGLIQTVGGPVHAVNNTWEATRDVLKTKTNAATVTPSSFDYTVNELGQRRVVGPVLDNNQQPVSTYTPKWAWDYNERGELIEADDKQPANHDRAYQFDGIGNREKTVNGLFDDLAQAPVNYVANPLNQYTTANGISLPSGPPPEGELPAHDADGNYQHGPLPVDQAQDHNATLQWDAENRLVKVTRHDGVVIDFAYDYMGRRIKKTVTPVSGASSTTCYIYDGFNCIAEYSGTLLVRTLTWGIDLSGSMQGAGGVGGLLVVSMHAMEGETQVRTPYYPTFDGNGNVSEYLTISGGVKAHFEYDPFGNTVVNTDDATTPLFTYRFSTKPLDFETGLYYYSYRYLDTVTGRWTSPDPIEEEGGLNLYGFVGNGGVGSIDFLGCETLDQLVQKWRGLAGEQLRKANVGAAEIALRLEVIEVALRDRVTCGDARSDKNWTEGALGYMLKVGQNASDVIPRFLETSGNKVCCKKHIELVILAGHINYLKKYGNPAPRDWTQDRDMILRQMDFVLRGPGIPSLGDSMLTFERAKGHMLPGDNSYVSNPYHHDMPNTNADDTEQGNNSIYLGIENGEDNMVWMGHNQAITLKTQQRRMMGWTTVADWKNSPFNRVPTESAFQLSTSFRRPVSPAEFRKRVAYDYNFLTR